MSEYFRKYIKKEHYPTPPYTNRHIVRTLNSKHPFEIASTKASSVESGNKPMAMIGTSCGAKKNKSIGFMKNIAFNPEPRSTISEGGLNYAEKICCGRTLEGINVHSISRVVLRSHRKF